MIFITLGSQKFQFNRLLKAVDEQVETGQITDLIFAQIGASDYKPQHFNYKDFLDRNEFEKWIDKADIVITHGGTGAIIGAIKRGKRVIAVARLEKYGEHVDDHQMQIIEQFSERDVICECQDCNKIAEAIKVVKVKNYKKYESNTSRIINSIDIFIRDQSYYN